MRDVQTVPYKTYTDNNHAPNDVVEWLTLLSRIRQVSDSNLGPENGYPD
jgi:hypothetical protein